MTRLYADIEGLGVKSLVCIHQGLGLRMYCSGFKDQDLEASGRTLKHGKSPAFGVPNSSKGPSVLQKQKHPAL